MSDTQKTCPNCGGELTVLLYTAYCAPCEAGVGQDTSHRGYIIWRTRPPGSTEYVFRFRAGAETWKATTGIEHFPIKTVVSPTAFVWRMSSSSSAPQIEIAEGIYEVYPDKAYDPGPRRVHIIPDRIS